MKWLRWLTWPAVSAKRAAWVLTGPVSQHLPGFSLLAEELLKQPLPIESGSLRVPDGPGFGVEVNEAVLHRFPWKSGAASGVA